LSAAKLDVAILGGGMAGNMLARQLARTLPGQRVALFEQKTRYGYTVGESTVEIASHYMLKRLGLSTYLYDRQYPKNGLRYFFDSPERDTALESMSEIGSNGLPAFPAFQIDRSGFEADLLEMNRADGIEIHTGARVGEIDLGGGGDGRHRFRVERGGTADTFEARWLVDATGRRRTLARSRDLATSEDDHAIAAVWGWFENVSDIDAAGPDSFRDRIRHAPRRLSTVHFLYRGYWIWFIPLQGGTTSVGVVADKGCLKLRCRTDDEFLAFLRQHRAVASLLENAKPIETRAFPQLAYGTRRFMSAERFALTGEAAAFPDPFYSPGADFIALANDFITDLVKRDLGGESRSRLGRRLELYDEFMRFRFETTMRLYRDQYPYLGSYELGKLKWDFDIGCYYNLWLGAYWNDQHLDARQLKRQLAQRPFVLAAMSNFAELFRRVDAHLMANGAYHRANAGQYSRGTDCLGFAGEVALPRSDEQVLARTLEIFNAVRGRALDHLEDRREPKLRAPLPLADFVGEAPLAGATGGESR